MKSFLPKGDRRRVPVLVGPDAEIQMGHVSVDDGSCTGCGLCVKACPSGALEMREGKRVRMIEAELVPCIACGDCQAICQPHSIVIDRAHAYAGHFTFLHRGALSGPRNF